jgi:succinoglycan biosynthesis protein ExoW
MTKVSVVIPYYQRKEGILRAAVLSALRQKTCASVQIIVVDDESPITARRELQDVRPDQPDALVIVEKKNGGAGAARNFGLDHVSADTDYVAFLDSDDVWSESHVERAIWALDNGYDFYFSDFYQLGQDVTAFIRGGRIRVEDHPRIHSSEPIYSFSSNMVDQILTGNILGTSVIVYNFKKFPDLRYPEDFRNAGEDYVFWIQLASRSRKIAFSSEPACRYGPGVNLFSDSGWGTDKYLTIQHDLIKYKKYLLKVVPLTRAQRNVVSMTLRNHRMDYGRGLVHNLIHNRKVSPSVLWNQIKLDPQTFLTLPLIPALLIASRFRRAA